MSLKLIDPTLYPILEKVENHQRISEEDALALYASHDLHGLGSLANIVRERQHGKVATFIHNHYLYYSNICLLSCEFCAFGAKKRDTHAFEFSIAEITNSVQEAIQQGITEIHMVGGLHPSLPGQWYLELLRTLKALNSTVHLKAFTAVEIRHLADRIFKLPLSKTLELLVQNGLDAITGGGAEIFDPEIRKQICRGKETAEEWAEVHRIWHQMGKKSTCTMLYGHCETLHHRIDHLRRLRALQDETQGFTGFVPFAFEPGGARPALQGIPATTAYDELKTLAISRIFLDNIPHLSAYWISLTLPLAQIALSYGVNDLHGTIKEEKIFHMAGATTPTEQSIAALKKAITEAGFVPMQRNTFYERIEGK